MKAVMLLALGLLAAQAAEPTGTLTLACEGTTTDTVGPDAKPEPISMGVVVNFTTRTVQGFGSGLLDYPVGDNRHKRSDHCFRRCQQTE